MHDLIPITLFIGLFGWLIARQHYRTYETLQMAALQRGLAVTPPTPPCDRQLVATVLIAIGVGFAIASFVSTSLEPDSGVGAALAVSIWGLVPLLVGLALRRHGRGLSGMPATDPAGPR
jgi:hypothetical protein